MYKTDVASAKYTRIAKWIHTRIFDFDCCCCRLFLSPYDLAPTYKNVHNKFSVKYYLNLVLVDEEDRRYFKQQEIILYRASDVFRSTAVSPQTSTAVLDQPPDGQDSY